MCINIVVVHHLPLSYPFRSLKIRTCRDATYLKIRVTPPTTQTSKNDKDKKWNTFLRMNIISPNSQLARPLVYSLEWSESIIIDACL